jgi:hypothetical protein
LVSVFAPILLAEAIYNERARESWIKPHHFGWFFVSGMVTAERDISGGVRAARKTRGRGGNYFLLDTYFSADLLRQAQPWTRGIWHLHGHVPGEGAGAAAEKGREFRGGLKLDALVACQKQALEFLLNDSFAFGLRSFALQFSAMMFAYGWPITPR